MKPAALPEPLGTLLLFLRELSGGLYMGLLGLKMSVLFFLGEV